MTISDVIKWQNQSQEKISQSNSDQQATIYHLYQFPWKTMVYITNQSGTGHPVDTNTFTQSCMGQYKHKRTKTQTSMQPNASRHSRVKRVNGPGRWAETDAGMKPCRRKEGRMGRCVPIILSHWVRAVGYIDEELWHIHSLQAALSSLLFCCSDIVAIQLKTF